MLSGAYRTPNIYCQVLGVYSNTGMVDAYRGAGRPEATYVVERAVDLVAQELDLDPVDVRRKNFIPPDAFPYDPGILKGLKYDTGDYEKASTGRSRSSATRTSAASRRRHGSKAATAGSASRPTSRSAGAAPSAWIGTVGEAGEHRCGRAPTSGVRDRQGRGHHRHAAARPGTCDHGLPGGCVRARDPDRGRDRRDRRHAERAVRLRDLRKPPSRRRRRTSTAASRRSRRRAGSPRTCSRRTPTTSSSRTERRSSRAPRAREDDPGDRCRAAALAYDLPENEEPFLDDTTYYDPPNCTRSRSNDIAVVDIDPETGEVTLERYIAVDDVGKVINPMIVDGQVHGGIAQGIAQALWEYGTYNESGQLVTGSMMHYAVPKADFFPRSRSSAPRRRSTSTRSASRAPARRGRLRDWLRSRTRSWTRSRRSGSGTSTCRSHPNGCGGRCDRRRDRREPAMYTMRPAEFEYHRPTSLDEAISRSARSRARERSPVATACSR